MKYFQQLLTLSLLLLLVLIFSLNKKENFTDVERKNALDNIKTQNDLFKSVFNKITNNDVTLGKQLTNPVLSGIKLSDKWSSYPDNSKDTAEISNDRGSYKALMIVGNKSAGSNRKVKIYDELTVHGDLKVENKITIGKNGTIYAGALNIGGVEIGADHLRVLTGQRHFFIKAIAKGGVLSDKGNGKFQGNKGAWEQMKIELN